MLKHEQLRAWRKARNLTQAQAAVALGVAPVTFREWESGRKPIRKLVWLALIGLGDAPERQRQERLCTGCYVHSVPRGQRLCEGCEAYRDHTGHFA